MLHLMTAKIRNPDIQLVRTLSYQDVEQKSFKKKI
jgi:hypothetical protein